MRGKIDTKRKPNYNRMVELLDYNLETGIVRWKVNRTRGVKGVKAGDVAGHIDKSGYRIITLDKVNYYAHRLAIYYVHGYWPENDVDHINRNKSDNRIENLREVSHSCNIKNAKLFKNNTTGVKGICQNKNKYMAYIWHKKQYNLGFYDDKTEAVFARYAGEQALGWKGCEANSPAFQYLKERGLLS